MKFYHLSKEREIYYEELAHVIFKAEKSYDLPSANWRSKKPDGLSPTAWEPGEHML